MSNLSMYCSLVSDKPVIDKSSVWLACTGRENRVASKSREPAINLLGICRFRIRLRRLDKSGLPNRGSSPKQIRTLSCKLDSLPFPVPGEKFAEPIDRMPLGHAV